MVIKFKVIMVIHIFKGLTLEICFKLVYRDRFTDFIHSDQQYKEKNSPNYCINGFVLSMFLCLRGFIYIRKDVFDICCVVYIIGDMKNSLHSC